ncbi:MAG: 16S rRNA (uracil1498-N3)-methyltransferase [Candidatus Aldehydirespiratoraceae bacterium]|jgi:16S rRNA (uracil1498-N3)-methyltransferase
MAMRDAPLPEQRRRSSTHVLLASGDEVQLDLDEITLDDEIGHHLARVLRLRDGEPVSVTDGAGRWRMTDFSSIGPLVVLTASSAVTTEPPPSRFTLATAIPKGDRVDWLVQKTVELGADRIILLHAERSTVRWKPERAAKQIVRLQRIADEATRQSRRVWRTEVAGPAPASDVLGGATIAEPGGDAIRGDEAMIAVGPEGGWSADELERSARSVRVGGNILRIETAAVAVTTLRMVVDH